jgi:outer membrane protein assembly factor BamB
MKSWVRVSLAITGIALLGGCSVFKSHEKKTPVLGQRVPILMSENDIAADKTIASVNVDVPEAITNDSWAQPGGNAAKSMGHVALGTSLSRAWQVSIPGSTEKERLGAPPVIADNTVFVMDVNAVVHAYAADTGRLLWQHATVNDKKNRASEFGGGVSYEDGKLYATNGLGDVVAMDAKTGEIAWTKKPGGPLRGSPTVWDTNLYVQTQDNQLFALAKADGSTLWTESASIESQGVFGVAAPAIGQGTVVAGFSSGELNAYRYENGQALWNDALSRTSISTSVSALSDIDAEPVIEGGRVYAIGQGGRMVALALVSGQRLWEQNLAGIASPWVAGPWLFVITDDARLLCIARESGKIRWISQLRHYQNEKKRSGPYAWKGPLLAGGRLLLTNSHGEIVSASIADGKIESTVKTGGSFTLAPVVANGTLYLLDDKGKLSAWR